MLEINQLAFSYNSDDQGEPLTMCFQAQVKRGEILSLIGPSGSGKSTLLNLIAGFIPSASGQIKVDGAAIEHLGPAKRPLSMVFQSHNLFPHLDVFTNIALGIRPSLKLTPAEVESITEALQTLGLHGLEKRKPGQLSGGQQQRVAIARALVREQPVLLLDEPFAALGPAMRTELIETLKALVIRKNMMALMVSHQPSDAMLASERTAFINNGEVIALRPTEQLLADTELTDIKKYLGTV